MKVADLVTESQNSSRSRAISQSLALARPQPPRGKCSPRVLLADDAPEMRAVLRIRLTKCGYDVTECRDGLELLTHLGSFLVPEDEFHAEHEDFDLIISDIRMPGASGLEVLEGMAGSSTMPPIILITAFGDEATRKEAMRLGASKILNKPFDLDELLLQVHRLASGDQVVAATRRS